MTRAPDDPLVLRAAYVAIDSIAVTKQLPRDQIANACQFGHP